MIRHILNVLCLVLALPAQAAMLQVVDDSGQRLAFTRPPQRIISLAPHLTELLFAVGAGPQVVGVDSASDFPKAAQALPRVGDFSRISYEHILALKPDLVVVWDGGNRAADIHGLEKIGIPVLHTQASRLQDVARLLRLLGRASGHVTEGEAAARDYSSKLDALGSRVARGPQVRTFYQVWDHPLMTVGGTHWISDALAVCGLRNVFADLRGLSPVVSREAVLQRAPELILSGSDGPDVRQQWEHFSSLPAVRHHAFIKVDADLLHRPTPRLIEGVAELCRAVEPYIR